MYHILWLLQMWLSYFCSCWASQTNFVSFGVSYSVEPFIASGWETAFCSLFNICSTFRFCRYHRIWGGWWLLLINWIDVEGSWCCSVQQRQRLFMFLGYIAFDLCCGGKFLHCSRGPSWRGMMGCEGGKRRWLESILALLFYLSVSIWFWPFFYHVRYQLVSILRSLWDSLWSQSSISYSCKCAYLLHYPLASSFVWGLW